MSVGRLGLKEGHAVAEELSDGSGWVIRPAVLMTQAELEILSKPTNVAAIERGLEDMAAGRVQPRHRR
jgi:predicted transcriptional regulator